MDSRLDRLITLLEDGNDDRSKEIAYEKIGGIVKLHHSSEELSYVIKRLAPLLRNIDPSTRINASKAFGEISKNIPQFDFMMSPTVTVPLPTQNYRKFSNFDPVKLLSVSEPLMKSEVKRKLNSIKPSSSRNEPVENSSEKRRKLSNNNSIRVEYKKKEDQESEKFSDPSFWPFHYITNILFNQLMSPVWYFRHGAALGLKEILNHHFETAGIYAYGNQENRKRQNLDWLEDCGVRVLEVLTLDRFCDFFGDSVKAPVREECAKVLAIIIKGLTSNKNYLLEIIRCLERMSMLGEWEARHSSLLGFTYIIQYRKNIFLQNHLLFCQTCLTILIRGLSDPSEDVISQSAEALLPLSEFITWKDVSFPNPSYKYLSRSLWMIMKDKDDISTHVSNVVKLLTSFYSHSSQMTEFWRSVFFSTKLNSNIPHLWKFLRHSLESVRRQTIHSFDQLVRLNHLTQWISIYHQDLIQFLFQNILLERNEEIRLLSYNVIDLVLKHFNIVTIDRSTFGKFITMISLNLDESNNRMNRQFNSKLFKIPENFFTESSDMIFKFISSEEIIKMQKWGCITLSRIIVRNIKIHKNFEFIPDILSQLARSKWSVHRRLLGFILSFLPVNDNQFKYVEKQVLDDLLGVIEEDIIVRYHDNNKLFCRLVDYSNEMLKFYKEHRIDISPFIKKHTKITVENSIEIISSPEFNNKIKNNVFLNNNNEKKKNYFEDLKSKIEGTRMMYINQRSLIHHPTFSFLSCGIIKHQHLPQNVSTIFRSMLRALKTETETTQKMIAKYLGVLTRLKNELSNKITFIIMDEMIKKQPKIERISELINLDDDIKKKKKKKKKTKKIPGGKVSGVSLFSKDDMNLEMDPLKITMRGMRLGLSCISKELGDNLFPTNRFLKLAAIQEISQSSSNSYRPSKLGISLYILREIIPRLSPSQKHHNLLISLLPKLISFLSVKETSIVEEASHTISVLTKLLPIPSMNIIHQRMILPLKNQHHHQHQQHQQLLVEEEEKDRFKLGAVFTIHRLIQLLQLELLPFVVLFILPLLKLMSDPHPPTRIISSSCFGLLTKILPLENAVAQPPGFKEVMVKERVFLEQLLDSKKIPEFRLPPNIIQNVTLRPYQKEGLAWLGFLNQFHLHGILCDDMGLGKTLQTICIMAFDIFQKKIQQKQQQQIFIHPSIVISPGTLIDHWYEEFKKFCPALKIVRYTGPRPTRTKIWKKDQSHILRNTDVLVMSYEICRNDVDFITSSSRYNYLVLDEGHIIKNPNSKISQAVKSIICEHRLVLSGTPVQNSVLELWSLFDFLMPGFLGRTRRAFQGRYGRSISRSREAKSGSRARAEGVLALESLHKQVLPFILRRLKEDVLDDLPPKIIQDYYCHLSGLQREVMDYYDRHIDIQGSNTFQKLEFLRKLVVHPNLVIKDVSSSHPVYQKLIRTSVNDFKVSPKLVALKQLLVDTGIAKMNNEVEEEEEEEETLSTGHRSLIFCQYQSTIETIINSLLNKMSVRYLRLDGTVAQNERQGVAKKFNQDPSYGLLLLTKRIGGYGLNLTGADMVIFIEHDYNFAVDKQAMDRCHRIGQKKSVNVYRLIVKNSIEEEKMGLQKFKKHVADSIINSENTSLDSLGTNNVIDKFG